MQSEAVLDCIRWQAVPCKLCHQQQQILPSLVGTTEQAAHVQQWQTCAKSRTLVFDSLRAEQYTFLVTHCVRFACSNWNYRAYLLVMFQKGVVLVSKVILLLIDVDPRTAAFPDCSKPRFGAENSFLYDQETLSD